MNDAAESALSAEQPWPGMRPYRERDAGYFFGRDAEVADLLARTERSPLTLLYARGGLGKTSMLRAGLTPRLVEHAYLPVYMRPRALLEGGRDAVVEVMRTIESAATQADIQATASFGAPSLWELFHREAFDLWDATNRLVTPVLVFDQFEEIFQLIDDDPSAAPRVKALLDSLAELVENRLPARLSASDIPADPDHRFDLASRDYRVILSFREDYLPQVRKLRAIVPSVIENHVRLEALSGVQALEVVERAGGRLIDHEAATMLVRGVGRRAGLLQLLLNPDASTAGEPGASVANLEVEPAVLSVVCFYLNAERRKRVQGTIDVGLVRLEKPEDIFDQYYRRAMAAVNPQARRFVESSLVTENGQRVFYPMKAIETQGTAVTEAISTLLDQGVLRKEWFAGEQHVEISHDLLLRPIRRNIEALKAAAARRERKRRQRRLGYGASAGAALLFIVALLLYQRQTLTAEMKQKENLSAQLLVAYMPSMDGRDLRDEMARRTSIEAPTVADLQSVLDLAFEVGPSMSPERVRHLRGIAVEYVQSRIERGEFSAGKLEPLLGRLRASVAESCKDGFTMSGDRKAKWFAGKTGGVPEECR